MAGQRVKEWRDFFGHGTVSNSLRSLWALNGRKFTEHIFAGFVWEHGTGIHRRYAYGCITEPTEREPIRPAPLPRRVGWQGRG